MTSSPTIQLKVHDGANDPVDVVVEIESAPGPTGYKLQTVEPQKFLPNINGSVLEDADTLRAFLKGLMIKGEVEAKIYEPRLDDLLALLGSPGPDAKYDVDVSKHG